jgi:hypothetical protein
VLLIGTQGNKQQMMSESIDDDVTGHHSQYTQHKHPSNTPFAVHLKSQEAIKRNAQQHTKKNDRL